MTDSLNSLLDISKLESGIIEPEIKDCEVQSIFGRLRSAFELQASAKGLELKVDSCAHVVRTDPGLLEQIIQNLLANAIRYTQRGFVHLRCLESDDNLRIEVLDTGMGFPETEFDTIFDEFYQVSREAGRQGEGLGLGLAIVRRLAQLLGHELSVNSIVGEGTRFAITVPRGERPRKDAEPPADRTNASARAIRVLVVDDDPAVADATAMLLETEGHEVMLAATVEEAAAQAAACGVPDLIVADFHLGGGERGIDAIQRVRDDAKNSIPAVLVTGDTSSLVAQRIQSLAQCRVLSKPVDTGELIGLIQDLVRAD